MSLIIQRDRHHVVVDARSTRLKSPFGAGPMLAAPANA